MNVSRPLTSGEHRHLDGKKLEERRSRDPHAHTDDHAERRSDAMAYQVAGVLGNGGGAGTAGAREEPWWNRFTAGQLLDLGQVNFSALVDGSEKLLSRELKEPTSVSPHAEEAEARGSVAPSLSVTSAAAEGRRKEKRKSTRKREKENYRASADHAKPDSLRLNGKKDHYDDDPAGQIKTGRGDVTPTQPPATTTRKKDGEDAASGMAVIINTLEAATGLDIDGDGKIAQTGKKPTALSIQVENLEEAPMRWQVDKPTTAGPEAQSHILGVSSLSSHVSTNPPLQNFVSPHAEYMNCVEESQQEAKNAALEEALSFEEELQLQAAKDSWMELNKFLAKSTLNELMTRDKKLVRQQTVLRHVDERLKFAEGFLPELLRGSKSTRDIINGLHHANTSLQSSQPIFTHLLEYQRASKLLLPLLTRSQEDDAFLERHAWVESASAALELLADEIIRYCVFHIDEPGPCGETPVHVAFLLGMSKLGKDMIRTTASFYAFDNILNPPEDNEQGGQQQSTGIRMWGRSCLQLDSAGGSNRPYVELVMMDDTLEPCNRTSSLEWKGLNCSSLIMSDAYFVQGVGSLQLRADGDVLCSIDILREVTAVTRDREQQARVAQVRPDLLRNTFKVTLLFGDKTISGDSERLTLYVKTKEKNAKYLESQPDLEVLFGGDEGGPTGKDRDAWQKLKQVLDVSAVRVAYAENMAKIINKPYQSDLDIWLKPRRDLVGAQIQEKYLLKKSSTVVGVKSMMSMRGQQASANRSCLQLYADTVASATMKKQLSPLLESADEALCTMNFCAHVHPWAVRGTLHPWKRKQPESLMECDHELPYDYDECEICEGKGGKDGGLFTGETLLHIVIVQHDCDSAEWLLDRGAHLDDRALGVFFGEQHICRFENDQALLSLRSAKHQIDENVWYSKSDFGEFPLSFAAAVGDERLCNLLLNHYSRRLDRMFALCALKKDGAIQQTASKPFLAAELALIKGLFSDFEAFLSSCGGQLFTEEQIEDFSMEMDEWIFAPIEDGGVGVEFEETIEDTETAGAKSDKFAKVASNDSDYQRAINEYRQVLMAAYVNRQTSLGNTALHQAVVHQRNSIIDWLLAHRGFYSMSILNAQKLTPFTIAARRGDIATMSHMINYQKVTIWKYGSVAMTLTDLEQIDTFRIQPEMEPHRSPNSVQRLNLKCDVNALKEATTQIYDAGYKLTRQETMMKQFARQVVVSQGRYEHQRLHQNPKYCSALEVVVKHEKGEFITGREDLANLDSAAMFMSGDDATAEDGIPLFEALIMEKWNNFARGYHIRWNLLPHYLCLFLFGGVMIFRTLFVYEARFGIKFPGVALGFGGFVGIDSWSIDDLSQVQLWFTPAVLGVSIPFLLFKASQEARFQAVDLDPNEDRRINFNEFLIFIYKNLGVILNCGTCCCMISQACHWYYTRDILRVSLASKSEEEDTLRWWNREFEAMGGAIFLMIFKALHLLMPFRQVGTMLITTWRMILSDILKWCSVYVFVLCAFSASSYMNVVDYHVQTGRAGMDPEHNDGVDNSNFWLYILRHFEATMGDTGQGSQETLYLRFWNFGFVIVNTLLLMNLLIAMMADTYSADKSKGGFSMWWMLYANQVLEYERQIRSWCELTGNKAWLLQHRTGMDPLPEQPHPETRHYCIKALEHSDDWQPGESQGATVQDSGGSRDLTTIQRQLNTVMQQQQEMLRAIAELKASTHARPPNVSSLLQPQMAAPRNSSSRPSLWNYRS